MRNSSTLKEVAYLILFKVIPHCTNPNLAHILWNVVVSRKQSNYGFIFNFISKIFQEISQCPKQNFVYLLIFWDFLKLKQTLQTLLPYLFLVISSCNFTYSPHCQSTQWNIFLMNDREEKLKGSIVNQLYEHWTYKGNISKCQ